MLRTTPAVGQGLGSILDDFGARLRLARLRRSFTTTTVAERAQMSRNTLARVERGDPAVAIRVFARVLHAPSLERE